MQIKKLAPSLMEQWIKVYEEERWRLMPDAITGEALAAYLKAHHPVKPLEDFAVLQTVRDAVLNNAFYAEKLPKGREPRPIAYACEDGAIIGIDLETGYFNVEGNFRLRDELTYVKGLDRADLNNVMRTVDWLRCKNLYEKKIER